MFERILRPDGSTVILLPQKDTKAVTFEVLFKVGSRQENKANNGVSHFVEHLMFKGTERRPNTIDISKELDNLGAEYNAFTGKEYTGYYIKSASRQLPLSVDILSDMIHNSKFDKNEIDRERGVIVEEINMYEDNPMMYIEDVFEELIFEGSDLSKSIAGPRVNIQTMSRNTLYNYYKKYYYPGNTVIGVAGKFDRKKALALIDKFFPIESKKKRVSIKPVKFGQQKSAKVDIVNRSLEQVQLMLGFRSVPATDKNYFASQVLANILGGKMSSRLFLNIRERRGLCYFIRSSINGYQDASAFTIQAGLNKLKIYEALSAIKEELNLIKEQGIEKEELDKAKENLRGRMILKFEDSGHYLNWLISQELIDKPIKDLEAKLKELDKISVSEINQLAKEVIDWPQANLTVIGPFKNKSKFLKILNS